MDELSLNVLLKLSPEEAAALDRVRADTLRATWIKQLVRGAVAARERQGGPTDVWVINEDEHEQLRLATEPPKVRQEGSQSSAGDGRQQP